MKLHLVIKLRKGVAFKEPPHWSTVIRDGQVGLAVFCSPIDEFFRRYNIPVLITAEYLKEGPDWPEEAIANGFDRIVRVVLLENTPISSEQLQELAEIEGGRIVEFVHQGKIERAPIPDFSAAQTMARTEHAHGMIHLKEAHEQFTMGHPDITVAVLDTGVDLSHPELQHCLLPGFDFVDILDGAGKFFGDYLGVDDDAGDEKVGHGTHVAGIIAAKGINMPVGVAPRCKILPVRVLGAMKQDDAFVGAGLVDNINNGIKWAVDRGVDVINMSLGIRHTGGGLPHQEVVEYAKSKGVSLVAASGNDGTGELYYPGALPHAMAVGALDEQEEVAPFSTHGKVSFVAPGTRIYSAYLRNGYAFSSGTSQASPFLAGLVALLKSYALEHGRRLTDEQLKYVLRYTSDRLTTQLKDPRSGFGLINVIDACKLLKNKLKL